MHMLLLCVLVMVAPGLTTILRNADPVRVDEPYVEFDFGPVPAEAPRLTLSITVYTTDPDISFQGNYQRVIPAPGGKPAPPGQRNMQTCENIVEDLKEAKFKAEVVDKTKIRVYGRTFNDKFLPAVKGVVESPDLKKEQLPKVKNPGKKL